MSGKIPVQVSGNGRSGSCLLFSTGFAGSRTDYGALCRLFEPDHLVVRITHPGSARWAGLKALVWFLWLRLRGAEAGEAARRVRRWIHCQENFLRRCAQLLAVVEEISRRYKVRSFSLGGHSYGTDTALRGALEMDVKDLYLFSPHPPGYLIPEEDYARLRADVIWLVTGTRDRTRDGVGPADRLKVAEVCDTRVINLEGVGHMDFAFAELGPEGWVGALHSGLWAES
ncbi:MAG: hypothetical protein KC800_13720 [Candidatus Eremiobacteraeota bacterium]|nr:hypothetical protein [Candidatus Eremiobacteraeota bacterium]